MTAQLPATQIDVGDAPTLQVVHAETFAEELASALAANLVEHVHLVANGLVGRVVPPSCIPNATDEGVGEMGDTGTVAQLVDGEVEVVVGNLSVAQFADGLSIVQIHLGQPEDGPVGRLGLVCPGAFGIVFAAPVSVECPVAPQHGVEHATHAGIGRV